VSGWLIPLLVGAATGVLSGFGVGGGTLLLVYMTTLAGLDQHLAQGINLLYFLPAGLTALPAHLKNGYVEKGLLFPAISAGLLCADGQDLRFNPRRLKHLLHFVQGGVCAAVRVRAAVAHENFHCITSSAG